MIEALVDLSSGELVVVWGEVSLHLCIDLSSFLPPFCAPCRVSPHSLWLEPDSDCSKRVSIDWPMSIADGGDERA